MLDGFVRLANIAAPISYWKRYTQQLGAWFSGSDDLSEAASGVQCQGWATHNYLYQASLIKILPSCTQCAISMAEEQYISLELDIPPEILTASKSYELVVCCYITMLLNNKQGLDTANPILKLDNRVFVGSWEDIPGTQLFFAEVYSLNIMVDEVIFT